MKFSFRITAIGLVAATLLVVLLSWGTDMVMWADTSRLATRTKPFHSSSHGVHKTSDDVPILKVPIQSWGDVKKENEPIVSISQDMCAFSRPPAANTDINSYSVLRGIDSGQIRSYSLPKKKHINSFASNSSALPLKVFVVPHSHSDPGWHKTVDNYFIDQTSHTLNNMVEKLVKYPKMRFIWAESVFLSLWWEDLSDEVRETVRGLLQNGQLEIVVGSWVVPDEATTHYYALVDQMIEGHEWLRNTMGARPKNVWTLDPFGYSATLPYLYKRAGFDNMVILRVHAEVKQLLQNSRNLEFFWRQHWDHDNHTDIFTQMMPYMLYNIKHSCGPDPDVCLRFDFRRIPGEVSESRAHTVTDSNMDELAKALMGQYMKKANLFNQNTLLVPLGDDFRYDRNIEWDQQYTNYQALFDYINNKKEYNIHMQFGTVQEYFDEVHKSLNQLNIDEREFFPSLSGDFFPYTDRDKEYWTGYFTTRPLDKTLGRELEVNLRNAEILHTLSSVLGSSLKSPAYNSISFEEELSKARQSLGLFQHHDAITGTETAQVAFDYEERLHEAISATRKIINNAASFLLAKDKEKPMSKPSLEASRVKSWQIVNPADNRIELNAADGMELVLLNSLASHRQELVRVVIDTDAVEVSDHYGNIIMSQLNPMWVSKEKISAEMFELVFIAELEPLSLTTFKLRKVSSNSKPRENYASHIRVYNSKHAGVVDVPPNSRFQIRHHIGDGVVLENDAVKARFSTSSGFLESLTSKPLVKTTKAKLNFAMYKSRMSGAYIFGPAGPAVDGEMDNKPLVRVVRGPVVAEVQVIQKLVNHTVRLCNSSGLLGAALEIINVVDMDGMDDKELVMHLDSDVENQHIFYTDLNGFQVVKRQKFTSLPPEANYYPMTTFAYLEDMSGRLSLIGAQPLGVSSQSSGSLEVMLDRRLLYDDNRGMGQGIRDNKASPSRFYLLLERPQTKEPRQELSQPSLLAHVLASNLRHYAATLTGQLVPDASHLTFTALQKSFPCDIELVNLRHISGSEHSAALVLHKLAHSCDYPTRSIRCSPDSSDIDLYSIFSHLHIQTITETTLSMMYKKKAIKTTDNLLLSPMEIYTYRVDFV